MTALIPNLNKDTAHLFCTNEDGTPYEIQDSVDNRRVTTGLLRFGAKFDLLSLSHSEDLLQAGIIDYTDSIGENISLKSLAAGTKEGVVKWIIDVPQPQPSAAAQGSGITRNRSMTIDYLARLPVGETYHDAHVYGSIDLQTGTTQLVTKNGPLDGSEDLYLIGYRLNAERVNYNRRPIVESDVIPLDTEKTLSFDDFKTWLKKTLLKPDDFHPMVSLVEGWLARQEALGLSSLITVSHGTMNRNGAMTREYQVDVTAEGDRTGLQFVLLCSLSQPGKAGGAFAVYTVDGKAVLMPLLLNLL